ncbi:MAG: hypothetical protein QXT68_00545 [Halobacteria archaeon]
MDAAAAPAPGTPPPSAATPHRELLHALARAAAPLLRGEEARVCIAGPPGSGKSGLLREFLPELHRAAAGRGLPLPVYFVDGRTARTAYGLLAALVRLAGGREPASGWSWGRLVESWRARVPGPAAVAVDHADEAGGVERLLRALAPNRGGLLLAVRSGSSLARRQPGVLLLVLRPSPPPPAVPVEGRGGVVATADAIKGRDWLWPDAGGPRGVAAAAGVPTSEPGEASPAPPPPSPESPDARSGAADRPAPPRPEMRSPRRAEGAARSTGGGGWGGGGGNGGPSPLRRVALLDDAPRLLLALLAREEGKATTGHLWRAYRRAAPGTGLRPLTLRRVSGLLRELEAADLVSAPVLSRGRRGRTKWAILTEEARGALQEMEAAASPPATEG